MVAVRQLSETLARPHGFQKVAVVPASGETSHPWTDFVVDGHHGAIAVRETRGRGLPLVLVHGNSSSKDAFRHQMSDALGATYRMLAVDLPGHGNSDDASDPEESYSLSALADAIVDTTERLGVERFALLGWSLGGHVALEIAASTPGVVGVMLVGTPPIGGDVAEILAAFKPGPMAALGGRPTLTTDETADFAEACGVDRYPELMAALRRSDGRARAQVFTDALTGRSTDQRSIVSSLAVPLAVVNGANDKIVNLDYFGSLAFSSLWEERFHRLPYAGHAPFLDVPELFNATLARFLRHLEREERPGGPGLCLGG